MPRTTQCILQPLALTAKSNSDPTSEPRHRRDDDRAASSIAPRRGRGQLPPVMDALRWMTFGGGSRPRWWSAGDSCSNPSRPCGHNERQ